MAGKKDKTLLQTAIESENPMAVGLVLMGNSHQNTMRVTQSLLDSYKKQIAELEEKVKKKDMQLWRVKDRIERFFFGAEEPAYLSDLDDLYHDLKEKP